MGCCRREERGQVAPVVALLMVVAGLACLGLGRFGGAAVDLAQARTAADAAALAGAAAGEPAARQLAEANGATLSAYEAAGIDVRAEATTASGATARARARATRGPSPGHGPRATPGVPVAALRAALERAEKLLGTPIHVVAPEPPWLALHERGEAVDVPVAVAAKLAEVAGEAGLCQPYPRTHPVHFEPCRERFAFGTPG